jgi:hypothetical protein
MAEPPTAWTAPGDDPEDRGTSSQPAGTSPPAGWGPHVPPVPPAPSDPTVGVPQAPPAGQQPNWGAPPVPGHSPGWGSGPGQPSQWGAPPNPGGQPAQWGAPTPGGQPQWGGPPAPGNWASRGQGIIPLRPLAIGEIYDGAIRAIRSNPGTMVGFSAIVIALLTVLGTIPQAYAMASVLNSSLADPVASQDADIADLAEFVGPLGISALVNVLQFVLATTIVSGLLIVAVDAAVRGQVLNPAQLWARCRSRMFAVLGLACAVVVAIALIVVVALLPGLIVAFALSSPVAGAILMVLGALVAWAVGVGLYFGFWAVAGPALLLENIGVFAALRRSYRLVKGGFWRVFGIGLLTAVIAYIIRSVFSIPFAILGQLAVGLDDSGSFRTTLIQLLVADIGNVLAGAVVFPFTAGVAALLYLDLRMRREGLDVELMRS